MLWSFSPFLDPLVYGLHGKCFHFLVIFKGKCSILRPFSKHLDNNRQITEKKKVYRCRIREQELFFRNFCGLTPDFIKRLRQRPVFFWSSLKNSWEIVRILRQQLEFVEIFVLKTFFFFFGLHLFCLFHTRVNFPYPPQIHINKLLVALQNLFLPPPPSHAILAPGLSRDEYVTARPTGRPFNFIPSEIAVVL